MNRAEFSTIIHLFALARIYSKRPQKCCALFCPKINAVTAISTQKILHGYVKEHL